MTLDEYIKKMERLAKEEQEVVNTGTLSYGFNLSELYADGMGCVEEHIVLWKEATTEHRQLAEWLKDYKRLQEAMEDIKAEIENLTITEGGNDYTRKMAELYSLKLMVLQIIDKHISGREKE